MPVKKIKWLARAERDLYEVQAYIAQDNPAAAVRTVLKIITAVETLAAHPSMGRAGRVEGTREMVVATSPYLVAYRVKDDVLQILRVLHAARQWPGQM